MDFLDILFPLLAIGAYFFFNTKKKQHEKEPQKPFSKGYEFEQYEEDEEPQYTWPEMGQFDKKEPFLSQNEQYTSYEYPEEQMKYHTSNLEQKKEVIEQDTDNEEEITENVSFELDDLKKAVIYSEILNRPYN